jgi:hypothetical protein
MQQVLASTSKVMMDYRGTGNLLYLPLDKIMQSAGAQPGGEGAATARRREIRPAHGCDLEAEAHAGEHGTENLRHARKPRTLEAEGAAERRQHFGPIGILGVFARGVGGGALWQLEAEAFVELDTVIGDGARRHVEKPGALARHRCAAGDRVGAVEALCAVVQAHEAVGIAHGKADHAGFRRRQRIGAGRSEMGAVADRDRTDAGGPGKAHRLLHGEIGGACAMGVVGVERGDRAEGINEAQLRARVHPPMGEGGRIMGKEPHAVAVDAEAGAVHHGAGRSVRRFLVSPDR